MIARVDRLDGVPFLTPVALAELVGGRLVLTSYGGLLQTLDPATGRSLDRRS
ncbi:MAG: hypothetical protein ABIT71_14975 [Vicinamibacteraceae bacterium]